MPCFTIDTTTLECRRTPWDERVFGHPCAEITRLDVAAGADDKAVTSLLARFDAWAAEEGVRFAYGRFTPSTQEKRTLHQSGFYFAEASYRIRHTRIQSTEAFDRLIRLGPVLEPAREEDYPALQDILAEDFLHGRIHEDPWVSREDASQRYRLWLLDLVAQRHEVLTYRLKGEVIGLHVQRTMDTVADLVLTGVKRSHALLGVPLWAEALRLNRLQGIREAHTLISAANVPILNLYRRFDFQFEALLLGFHKRY